MIAAAFAVALLAIFSTLAFWRPNPVLFMITAGISMILGLNAPDLITSAATTTSEDLTIGLSLIIYSFLCIAYAFKVIFWDGETDGD